MEQLGLDKPDIPLTRSEHNKRRKANKMAVFILATTGLASSCALPSEGLPGVTTAAPEFTTASWNVLYDPNAESEPDTDAAIKAKSIQIVEGVKQLFDTAPGQANASVVMLQEVTKAKYREQLKKDIVDCATCTHGVFFAETNHGSELPIFWDENVWRLEDPKKDTETIFATPKKYFDDGGSGGSEINDRYITRVDLTHVATGVKVRFADTHVLPDNELPTREKYFEKHMDVLHKFIKDSEQEDIDLVLGADINRNLRKRENQKILTDMGLKINWVENRFPAKGGTHNPKNNAVIDVLASSGNVSIIYTRKWSDANGSDHRPVLGIYRLGEITSNFNSTDD